MFTLQPDLDTICSHWNWFIMSKKDRSLWIIQYTIIEIKESLMNSRRQTIILRLDNPGYTDHEQEHGGTRVIKLYIHYEKLSIITPDEMPIEMCNVTTALSLVLVIIETFNQTTSQPCQCLPWKMRWLLLLPICTDGSRCSKDAQFRV